jgi:predicted metal-dependent phosphoesterase TrpH
MIKADFHIHSSASYDSRLDPWEVVTTCLRRGLGAFAVADHNRLAGSLAVAELLTSPSFADFMARFYPGRPFPRAVVAQEVNTVDGEIMGMFLSKPLTRGLSFEETVAEIREQGGVVNVPHPFARIAHRRPRFELLERNARNLDAVEVFNARNFYRADDRVAWEFARRHNLGRTAGSDAHLRGEIGRGFVVMPEFDDRASFAAGLRKAIPRGRKTPPLVPLMTWLRNPRGVAGDMRLQYRLTGRV